VSGVEIPSRILNIFLYYIYHSAVLLTFIHIQTIFSIQRLRFLQCQINWRTCRVGTRRQPIREDEYSFREEEDEHLKGTPSIVAFVNGDGLLNSDNILRKSFTVEDVENVLIVKASNADEIGTKEEMSPTHSLSRKGHESGGGKNGEAMKKKIADASLVVCNAYVKEESDVEKLDPISSTGTKHGEENSFGQGQRSSISNCPSRALFENNNKNVEIVKLGSSRVLVSLSKKVHPRVKEEDGYNSQSDGNIPLTIVFKRNPACPPLHEA
jgi:hypothetical protein